MSRKSANVLFIAGRGDTGTGAENYLPLALRYWDKDRFRAFVVLPSDGTLRQPLEELGAEIHVVPSEIGWLEPPRAWYQWLKGSSARVKQIVKLIEEKNIDLVHTNHNYRLEGALAARLAGVKHIYMAHLEFEPELQIARRFPMERASYARLMGDLSTKIVAVSKKLAETLSPPVEPEKVVVVSNGIELDRFDKALADKDRDIRGELGIAPEAILISAVGSIHANKGFDYLVQAAQQVLAKVADVHFLVVGAVDNRVYAEELHREVARLGIGDRFHFTGFRQDVPEILAQSDVFVLPSRREGHPFVLLEAMACRCAIVASRCAGVEDTVTDGESALLFDIGDIETLTRHLLTLLRESELRRKLAENGRNVVSRDFTASASIQKLMSVYEAVLAAPESTAGAPAVEFFLQGANEIGDLGLRVTELENRIRELEHLNKLLKENPLYRTLRSVVQRVSVKAGKPSVPR